MTKKLIMLAVLSALVAGMVALPAEAAKKKKPPKPVLTTLYLDGESTFGEEEQAPVISGKYLKLAAEAGAGEKSMGIPNYVGGPNTNCAGNSLMPVFTGPLAGTVVGEMKVTFDAGATPAQKVEVRVWPDLAAQACNEAYLPPAGSVIVDLPVGRGTVEATIENLNFTAVGGLMIQITPVIGAPPGYGRAFYGTDASKIEFSCTPSSGSSCIPS